MAVYAGDSGTIWFSEDKNPTVGDLLDWEVETEQEFINAPAMRDTGLTSVPGHKTWHAVVDVLWESATVYSHISELVEVRFAGGDFAVPHTGRANLVGDVQPEAPGDDGRSFVRLHLSSMGRLASDA